MYTTLLDLHFLEIAGSINDNTYTFDCFLHVLALGAKMGVFETDEALVNGLIANETEAWLQLSEICQKPLVRHRKHLEDFNSTVEELFNQTVIYLKKNDCAPLREFQQNGSSFIGFLYWKIRDVKGRLLYRDAVNREKRVSDPDLENSPSFQTAENLAEEKDHVVNLRNILNQAFFLLYESNPQRANIYLMREKLKMPSKEVAVFWNLTVSNVDATCKRAKDELAEILKEMGYGGANDLLNG